MKEAQFITEVMNSLKDAGCEFVFKPADNPMSWTQSVTRFTPAKPCDIITCDKKGMILIECKMMKKLGAFGPGVMQPSQIKALTEAVKMGQRAFVFLNIRMKSPHRNECFVFPWEALTERWKKRGSIKKKDFENLSIGVSYYLSLQGRKERFDLSSLLTVDEQDYGF